MVGEFLSAPAITVADAATLGYLDDDVASYGRQRMFGSFGWAIAMLFVGTKSFNYYVTDYYVINYCRLPLPE